jgi:chromosome partitioning protein
MAAEMAAAGSPTLMIDLDPQANASKALGVDSDDVELTIYEVLHPDPDKRVTIAEAMVEVAPNLYVVSGHKSMTAIAENGAGPGTEMLLARALRAVKDRFRAIFVDCPPNLGRLFMMAMAGGDDDEIVVTVPVKCGPFELDGLGLMLDTIDKIRRNGLAVNLRIVATVATMFDGRRNIDRDVDAYLAANFPDEHVDRPIRTSVRLVECADEGVPLRDYSPRESVNGDLANLAYVVAQRSLT